MTIANVSSGTVTSDIGGADREIGDAFGPRLARVTVLGSTRQVDVGLPADVPISAIMADLVRLLEPIPADDAASASQEIRNSWTLGEIGREPLSPQRSLAENDIYDGDLLMLRRADDSTPAPLFDDVIEAVAEVTATQQRAWTADTSRLAGQVFGVLAAITGATTTALCRLSSPAVWPASLAIIAVAALVTAATIVARQFDDRATGTALSLAAALFAVPAGLLLVPGSFGAEHILLAAALAAAVATLSYRLTSADPLAHSALITLGTLIAIAALIQLLSQPDSPAACGTLLAMIGLLTIAAAPRLTVLLAGLPMPPVPTVGEALDPADIAPRPTIAGVGAVGSMTLPSAEVLTDRVQLGQRYLTGIIVGATAATAVGATLVAPPWSALRWQALVFAAVITGILILRGRTHNDRVQTATLIAGGSAAGATVATAVATISAGWALGAVIASMLMTAAAFGCGVWAPTQQFSPVMRRVSEIAEYLLIAAVVPLAIWVMDLYQLVRNL
jgi:type VII secretion integral membrane protein EccD